MYCNIKIAVKSENYYSFFLKLGMKNYLMMTLILSCNVKKLYCEHGTPRCHYYHKADFPLKTLKEKKTCHSFDFFGCRLSPPLHHRGDRHIYYAHVRIISILMKSSVMIASN